MELQHQLDMNFDQKKDTIPLTKQSEEPLGSMGLLRGLKGRSLYSEKPIAANNWPGQSNTKTRLLRNGPRLYGLTSLSSTFLALMVDNIAGRSLERP